MEVFDMKFSNVFPLLIAKVERKGCIVLSKRGKVITKAW